MEIKLNADIGGHRAGAVIKIDDRDGIPTSRFWRRRLVDAELDGCCEVVTQSTASESHKTTRKKKTEER